MEPAELLEHARLASESAYAPYSHLRVGAVVVTADGTLFTGANVENAAYPSTLCAEAVAIGTAVASGERALETVAVISPDVQSIYPCGQCRQRMAEFGVKTVVIEDTNGTPRVHTFDELLPRSFENWRRA